MVSKLLRIAGALGIVAGITFVYARILPVNSTTVALTLLLGVLGVATLWGLVEATVASLAGMLAFNFFFLPPVGTFTIADPQNWVALAAFLIVSVVASHLSTSAKHRAVESARRQREMERLYELSRSLMLTGTQSAVAGEISYQIATVFDLAGCAFFDRAADRVYRAGPTEVPVPDAKLRDAAVQGTAHHDSATGVMILPVSLGGPPVGSLAILGQSVSDTALHSIANLAAIDLERARAQEVTSRAEAARQNEELKSAILDALAHEFKTPLTSTKAAVSAMLDTGCTETQRELLTIVNEETDRLTSMVTEAIQLARIEAGDVRLEKSLHLVPRLVSSALKNLDSALEGRRVEMEFPDHLPAVFVDAGLIGLAIRQLTDNALKYSPPNSPITFRAQEQGESVIISLADRGSGIPPDEQPRLFEKFYRGRHFAGRVAGTGMGLTIAREIVEAHGGKIWFESQPGTGSEFFFSLEAAKP